MSNLIAKQFEDYNIRIFNINDELYFVGRDIAIALGYSKPRDAIVKNRFLLMIC